MTEGKYVFQIAHLLKQFILKITAKKTKVPTQDNYKNKFSRIRNLKKVE
jgi:hypothetical protein